MSIDKCISEEVSECKSCEGYNTRCINYIPQIYDEMYEETKIDKFMEGYKRLKEKAKNGTGVLLRLWKGN